MSPVRLITQLQSTCARSKDRHSAARVALLLAAFSAAPALGTIYYVSPTGSDMNSGTSAGSPWGSVAKVDASNFAPGDEILFQYGSSWNASLDATTSGTTSAPIVYGAYGNSSLGNPTFYGSNPISSSAFTPVTGTTYQMTASTPVNWIFDNHQFTREAQDATSSSDPATDLSFVESTAGSFYYNASNGQLFVNPGSAIASQTITAGVRQDAIDSKGMSNLLFRNLNTSETAADGDGYGIQVDGSTNVKLLDSTMTLAGKHSLGVVNSVGFTGTNIVVNGSAPDQGFGGASAVATYGDGNAATGLNNSAVITNLTYTGAFGAYAAFLSHGATGGIASVVLNNVVSQNGYGTGVIIYSTGASETALINGGKLDNNTVELDTNNSVVNGLTVTGTGSSLVLKGTNDVVQNNTLIGQIPNPYAGDDGLIVDSGTSNIIRFNTMVVQVGSGPAVSVTQPGSNTNIYGNIFSQYNGPEGTTWLFFDGTPVISSNYNLLDPKNNYAVGTLSDYKGYTLAQWQAMGYDTNSPQGNPIYTDQADGIYVLASNSPGIGAYTAALDSSLTMANSLVSSTNANGSYNAGINPSVLENMNSLQTGILVNNGQTNNLTPVGNTLTITTAGALISGGTSTLNVVGNVVNTGNFVSLGGLIQSGYFNNSGTAVIGGSQLWSPGAVFTNMAGSAIFETDAGGTIAPAEYLNVAVQAGFVTFGSSQHLNSLTVAAGASAMVTNSSIGRSIVFTPSLSVAGRLDLTSNDLVVESGSPAAVTALVKQGYNLAGGGNWTGQGITSSTAATNTTHLTGLGVILNTTDGTTPLYGSGTALGLFDGSSPAALDVLVRYTYIGDANLDGKVDVSDYSRIDNGFVQHLTGWYNGDFNYDGVVNGSDYTLIDNAFNSQGAVLTAEIGAPVAVALNTVAVPEPASVAMLGLFVPLMLRRRGRSLTADQAGL